MPSGGDRLLGYALVRPLARGGDDVWLARGKSGEPVAIRLLRLPAAGEPNARAKAEKDLLEHVERVRPIRHPGLVSILEAARDQDTHFVAVDLADGGDLGQLLDTAATSGQWPPIGTLGFIALEVARALAHLHGLGVVYRELRPSKVLFDRTGRVKLADLAGCPPTQRTIRTDAEAPSPSRAAYRSPEQIDHQPADARSDVFALGSILWHLVGRRSPFLRTSEEETLRAIAAADVPALRADAEIPPALIAVLDRALDRDPVKRFQSAGELALELTIALRDHHKDARTDSIVRLLSGERGKEGAPPRDTIRAGTNLFPEDLTIPDDPFFEAERDLPFAVGSRFEILGRLGEGGMGEVYRAKDNELGEVIALKVLSRNLTQEPAHLERLRREVRLARKIATERVCRIYDLVELKGGTRCVTMQLLKGQTMAELMREGVPLDYARFSSWAADVAEGLAAAHALSIVHRDLKPDNVMITDQDRAVILDFGVAISVGLEAPSADKLTAEGVILGTLPYMSPEQLTAKPLDGRCDLYALGLIVAELATGEVPASSGTYHEVLDKRVLHAQRFDLLSFDPGAPKKLAVLVGRLLEPLRENRPPTAEEVALELRVIAAELRGEDPSRAISGKPAGFGSKPPLQPPSGISGPPRSAAPPPAPAAPPASPLPPPAAPAGAPPARPFPPTAETLSDTPRKTDALGRAFVWWAAAGVAAGLITVAAIAATRDRSGSSAPSTESLDDRRPAMTATDASTENATDASTETAMDASTSEPQTPPPLLSPDAGAIDRPRPDAGRRKPALLPPQEM